MLIKGKTNLNSILIVLVIFTIIGGGIYYWRVSREIAVKEMKIVAGVVPHHLLAESLIEDFFDYISSKEKPETIILLSPDHFNAGSIF